MGYYFDYESLGAGILGIIGVLSMILLALAIVVIMANWKMFKKAGKGGWECIVPFYGQYVLVELAGLNWWWFLLLILEVAFKVEIEGLTLAVNICGFLASFNCYYNIAKKFGKDKTTSIFAGLFPVIFVLIFGFSKNEKYDNNISVNKNGIFSTSDENISASENVNDDKKTDKVSYCGKCGTKMGKDVKFCPNCGEKKL